MVDETQKRYADDITVQELVRLRVQNEIFGFALDCIANMKYSDSYSMMEEMQRIANDALQRANKK